MLTFVWRLNVYVRYVYQHCMLLCQTISFYTALYLLSLCFILIWVWWCGRLRGRAVMHDARPSLFIFAVLCAVLRSGFRDTATQWCNCGQSVQIWCSVLLYVPEGRKLVLGNYNYPSRRDGHSMRTDAKNIIIFFFWGGVSPLPRVFNAITGTNHYSSWGRKIVLGEYNSPGRGLTRGGTGSASGDQ